MSSLAIFRATAIYVFMVCRLATASSHMSMELLPAPPAADTTDRGSEIWMPDLLTDVEQNDDLRKTRHTSHNWPVQLSPGTESPAQFRPSPALLWALLWSQDKPARAPLNGPLSLSPLSGASNGGDEDDDELRVRTAIEKRKRGNYMAYCHFKMCNLGRKRKATYDLTY